MNYHRLDTVTSDATLTGYPWSGGHICGIFHHFLDEVLRDGGTGSRARTYKRPKFSTLITKHPCKTVVTRMCTNDSGRIGTATINPMIIRTRAHFRIIIRVSTTAVDMVI